MADLTHIGPDGRARMVDISDKPDTERTAVATGCIRMMASTRDQALRRDTKKGDPLAIAELAGIMGAKRTSDLIPLCHSLPLTSVTVAIKPDANTEDVLRVTATARTTGKTGVEMEALTAVSITCLTLYDMLKAIDKGMVIGPIELVEKTGGKSGNYRKGAS